MATVSYTSLLGLALPTQGDLSGTWGTETNNFITTYIDSAVAGVQTISGTQTAVTLSVTNGSTLVSAGVGATGSSQYMIINCTGTPASLLTITAPAASKVYAVINATAQSVKLVGVGPTTGVTLVTGEKAVCAWNGTDFVKMASSLGGVSTISFGSTGLTPSTATSGAVSVAGTLAVANGGTSLATLTANNVIIGNGTAAPLFVAPSTSGNVLTSNGTTWASTAPAGAGNLTGAVTSVGLATSLGSFSSSALSGALTDETGTGSAVFATSPTLVTPLLGTPTSGVLSNCTVDGTNAVGFRNIPQNIQASAYTMVLGDSGNHIFHALGAAAATYTIPANSSVAYPIGTALTFINMAVAVVSIAITTDTLTLSSAGTTGTRSLAQYGSATCIKITSTSWLISGSGLS